MKSKIGVIGGGNMGSAIIAGVHKRFVVYVCEQDKRRGASLKRKYNVKTVDLKTLFNKTNIIVLAVKPQSFESVLREIRAIGAERRLFISIAAGITTKFIEQRLGKTARVVRTMPNLPAQVKEGVTAVSGGKTARAADVRLATEIFSWVGPAIVVKESMMDAVTAVSGSGPAYVFLFIECLQKAAAQVGLKGKMAEGLILQTIKGSLKLFENDTADAKVLKKRVTSKGGTTQAAMNVFEKRKISDIFTAALKAAKKRSKELSK